MCLDIIYYKEATLPVRQHGWFAITDVDIAIYGVLIELL